MTYGHLQADCLYTGISSGPNARYRVWEAFTFTFTCAIIIILLRPRSKNVKCLEFIILKQAVIIQIRYISLQYMDVDDYVLY